MVVDAVYFEEVYSGVAPIKPLPLPQLSSVRVLAVRRFHLGHGWRTPAA
jgi:hypothetical protein